MINQRQMRIWIPEAVESFKAIMPPIDVPYPEFIIASAKTAENLRSSTVSRLRSPQKHAGSDAIAETIHGDLGDAIIIYQNNFKERLYTPKREKQFFLHICWHELGHFYSIYTESPGNELYRYLNQESREEIESQMQTGYWFWTEFIAEAIACHIDPDVDIDWDQVDWHDIRNSIRNPIREAFTKHSDLIDEYSLGHYFAGILTNKAMTAFLEAAEDGRARAVCGTKTLREAGIDPDCRSEVSENNYPHLDTLEELLREQLLKEEYWRIEPAFLLELSKPILQMSQMKSMDGGTRKLGNQIRRLTAQEAKRRENCST